MPEGVVSHNTGKTRAVAKMWLNTSTSTFTEASILYTDGHMEKHIQMDRQAGRFQYNLENNCIKKFCLPTQSIAFQIMGRHKAIFRPNCIDMQHTTYHQEWSAIIPITLL